MLRIKDIPLGTLAGGAQASTEMSIARSIREGECQLGQRVNTFDIPGLVATVNERHGFVSAEDLPKFAANVAKAYDYVTSQTPLRISRAAYLSYKAEGVQKAVEGVVQQVGGALGREPGTSKLT